MSSDLPKKKAFLRERDALIDHIAKILAEEYLRLVRQGNKGVSKNGEAMKRD